MIEILPWAVFLVFVAGMLALDLGVFHKEAHAVSRREALIWSGVWIGLSLIFCAGVFIFEGHDHGVEWLTGYLVEKSLSVDNVFLFIMIFSSFAVPPKYQHRVLFWGILGALIMRGALIAVGAAVLDALHWAIYLFGAFLVFTGIRFLVAEEKPPELDANPFVRFAKRFFPVTAGYEGQSFFVRRAGVLYLTPLFLVLLLIESTDLVFALDSIPAIFAITDDTFIIFTSNVFAILGLRALYFVLNGYLGGLAYLKPALAVILVFVGTKMITSEWYHMPPLVSLAVILGVLVVAILASIWKNRQGGEVHGPHLQPVHQPADAGGAES
jgi:tellurite resistance protein TerC